MFRLASIVLILVVFGCIGWSCWLLFSAEKWGLAEYTALSLLAFELGSYCNDRANKQNEEAEAE